MLAQGADLLVCVLQFDHYRVLASVENLVIKLDAHRNVLLRKVSCAPDVLLDLDKVDGTFLEELLYDVGAFIVSVNAIFDDFNKIDAFF